MITDLRSEIFLIEIRMNWIFICIYTRIVSFISMCTYFAFFIWMCIRGLSSFAPQLRHYNTLCSNCNRISNRIAIICEICIQVANRILMLNLGLWFLRWANPIRGLINLSDGNAISDHTDINCATQSCCKRESNSSWLFLSFTWGHQIELLNLCCKKHWEYLLNFIYCEATNFSFFPPLQHIIITV